MISRTFRFWAAVLALSANMSAGRAQDNSATAASHAQSESLGDAARKARAQKPHPGKPAKVFTNDDVRGLKPSFSEKSHGKQTSQTSSAKTQSSR